MIMVIYYSLFVIGYWEPTILIPLIGNSSFRIPKSAFQI